MAGICVKDHYNLGLGVPIRDIVDNELKVQESRRQIAFERQRRDAERVLDLCQFDWDIDVKRFFLSSHVSSFRETELRSRKFTGPAVR